MATIIDKISITIDGVTREDFKCRIGDTDYFVDNIELDQKQAEPNQLSFYIMLISPFEKASDVTFTACAEAIGKKISISVKGEGFAFLSFLPNKGEAGEMTFNGFITNMTAERNQTAYAIKVTAHSFDYLLTMGKNCRSFMGMTLEEVVNQILENYGDDIPATVNPRYTDELPYTMQYNESDYDFLKRLAAQYGEWIYNDGEQFVFGQMVQQDTVDLSYSDLHDYSAETRPVNLSQSFIAKDYTTNMFSVGETQKGLNPTNHPLLTKIKEASVEMLQKEKDDIIRTAAAGNYDSVFYETRNRLMIRNNAARKLSNAISYTGNTFCTKMKVGAMLTIKENFIGDPLGTLLNNVQQEDMIITELVHYFTATRSYYNTFKAKPLATADSPGYAFIAAPTAESCTATVVDNEDPELLGRIRVQFDWQSTYGGDMITPWLRIVHPYAGGGKGFSFIPEIGEEVMVLFAGGNPDKPFVLGTLFNGSPEGITDPKWLQDSNHANQIKAIRTRNGHTIEIHDEGNDGYIRIYDNEKENYILTFSTDEKLIKLESTGNIELYAKNDIIMHADNDIFIEAGHDMQRVADNDIREHAGNDRATSIDNNDSLTVESNQYIKVNNNKIEEIAHSLQTKAENIRTEAGMNMLLYSTTSQTKASAIAINGDARIDIKGQTVKIN